MEVKVDQNPILTGVHDKSEVDAAPLMLYAPWHMSIANNLAVDPNSLGDKQVRNVDQAYRLAI
jgi:hypothetical protein